MPDPAIAPAVLAEDLRADPDDRADVYVRLSDGPVARSREAIDGVTVDFDATGQPVGVEILDALQVTINGVPVAAPVAGTAEEDDEPEFVPCAREDCGDFHEHAVDVIAAGLREDKWEASVYDTARAVLSVLFARPDVLHELAASVAPGLGEPQGELTCPGCFVRVCLCTDCQPHLAAASRTPQPAFNLNDEETER